MKARSLIKKTWLVKFWRMKILPFAQSSTRPSHFLHPTSVLNYLVWYLCFTFENQALISIIITLSATKAAPTARFCHNMWVVGDMVAREINIKLFPFFLSKVLNHLPICGVWQRDNRNTSRGLMRTRTDPIPGKRSSGKMLVCKSNKRGHLSYNCDWLVILSLIVSKLWRY